MEETPYLEEQAPPCFCWHPKGMWGSAEVTEMGGMTTSLGSRHVSGTSPRSLVRSWDAVLE